MTIPTIALRVSSSIRSVTSGVKVVNHSENLGPVKTFNLFFKSVQEPSLRFSKMTTGGSRIS